MIARSRFSALLFAPIFMGLLFTACHTAQKFVESGDYDGAIAFCVKKLRGKPKKDAELVQGLELAYQKAQERDFLISNHLIAENRPENWEKINRIQVQIRNRQNLVRPLTPLVSKDGYQASFRFVDIESLESESRANAAEYLYQQAVDLLARADQGDRPAARRAFDLLTTLEQRYYRTYKDKEQLKSDAIALGTTHILFEVKTQMPQMLPPELTDRLSSLNLEDGDRWKAFHFRAAPGIPVDYRVVYKVRQVDVSPEQVNERSYVDEKRIQDGWEYVLDKRGNVKKDTLGNDIKTPKYINVRARVIEVFQSKATRMTGTLEIYDAARNALVYSREIGTEVLFENYASTFKGDERALSEESCRRIGAHPVPFPDDLDMLAQAIDRVKPDIRDEMRGNRVIL